MLPPRCEFSDSGVVQAASDRGDPVGGDDPLTPLDRNPRQAPARTGKLARDRCGGVGVVAEVGGTQHRIAEVGCTADGPQRRLERVDAVAGTADRGWLLAEPGATRDRLHLRVERTELPEVRREYLAGRSSSDQRSDHRSEHSARVSGPSGWVSGATRLAGALGGIRCVGVPADRHGRQSHQRPVGGRILVGLRVDDFTADLETGQRQPGGCTDVETRPGRRPISVAVPTHVSSELIDRIEFTAVEDRLGQAHRHRRVIGPRTRPEPERTTTDHVGDRRERTGRLELERGADGVADRQTNESTACAVACRRHR